MVWITRLLQTDLVMYCSMIKLIRCDLGGHIGKMSSSDAEASLAEEKWDDMAIVRAFEDAMHGKRNQNKHAHATESSNRHQLRKETSKRKQSVASTRESSSPRGRNLSGSTRGAIPRTHDYDAAVHTQSTSTQSPEEIYQAAYAQAYAHLQAQWQQPQYQYAPAFTPSYSPQTGYSLPPQWNAGMRAGAQAPVSHGMPFPSATGVFASSDGSQDDLANLLLSWYQSGYYTGRFQAMREMNAKNSR